MPVILKPRYGAGSRQVVKISNQEEWKTSLHKMPYNEDFIVEDAVEGQEYGIDGIVIKGTFHLILVRKKLITSPPYRQCVGYISINNNQYVELLKHIQHFMSNLITAIKLDNGIIHADIIYDKSELFVIEMSSRPSGHRLHDIFVPMVTGIDMISEFINYVQNGYSSIEIKKTDKVYMIRYFDMESKINTIPPEEYLIKKYSLLKYECNLVLGESRKIRDGHSIMGRGFFILEGKSESEVCEVANNVLHEYM